MARYHITKAGNPGVCKAKLKCPLGDLTTEHYDSKEEAREAFEKAQNKKNISTLSKAPKETPVESDLNARVFIILENNLEKAKKSIDRANLRLKKEGIKERFDYDVKEILKSKKNAAGFDEYYKIYEIELNSTKISQKGYEFQAVLTKDSHTGQMIVKSGKDVELGGARPDSMKCEHCGQSRARSKTYLIKTPQGDVKQIGSSCVDAYLGVKPEGLWALGYEPVEDDGAEAEKIYSSGGPVYNSVDQSLAVALAVSEGGQKYVSTRAEYGIPTSDQVSDVMNGHGGDNAAWRKEMQAKAEEYLKNGSVERLKEKIRKFPGDTDYEANLKTLISSEVVSGKNSRILNSAVSILGREERAKRIEEEKKAREEMKRKEAEQFTKGHYGKEGDKIPKGTKFKVISNNVMEKESYGYNSYTYDASRLTMIDDEGHQIVWFANQVVEAEPGGEIEVSSGKVKRHGEWQGVDQTVISNVRLMKNKK